MTDAPPAGWSRVRVDWLMDEVRDSIGPEQLAGREVFHYSIPALAESGDGVVEDGDSIASSKPLLKGGELLVSKLNPRKGHVLIARAPVDPTVCSGEFIVLRSRACDVGFMFYVFSSEIVRQELHGRVQSVTKSHQRVSPDDIAKLWITVPSLELQRRIADFLDRETARIDALVQQKRLLLERLQGRRRSIIFHGITGLLGEDAEVHDPGLPWARAIRKPWPVVKIKHVARLGTGHTPSRSRPELWENCTIPWITTGEIQQVRDDRVEVITETREKISEIGIANSAAVLHPAGTVVPCRTASAGFSAIMGTDMATSQDFATWTCSDRLLPRYLLMCLRAMRRDLLGRLAFGSTHRTIYMPDIEELKIPLPSVEEQQQVLAAIDSRLAKSDALTERLEQQLAALAEHRQVLITAAVAGQIDVSAEAA